MSLELSSTPTGKTSTSLELSRTPTQLSSMSLELSSTSLRFDVTSLGIEVAKTDKYTATLKKAVAIFIREIVIKEV